MVREFTRLAKIAVDENVTAIPIPNVTVIRSFLQYHRLKERGGRLVGGQTLEDQEAFALQHEMLRGFYSSELTSREMKRSLSCSCFIDTIDYTSRVETDETYKSMPRNCHRTK